MDVHSALSQWKSTRAQLGNTILSYMSACITLSNVCALSSDKPVVEHALVTLDDEIKTLQEEEELLRDLRCSITKLRNKSTTLAPINVLSTELLTYVFTSVDTPYCLQRYHTQPTELPCSFSVVCSYWRQVAMNTPALWSHIDIGPRVPADVTRVLLTRALFHPIYLHYCETDESDPFKYNTDQFTDYSRAHLIDMILPHVHRIYALDLLSKLRIRNDFIHKMLQCWLDHGDARLAQYLSIDYSYGMDAHGVEPVVSQHAHSMLRALSELQMSNLAPMWDISVHSGLVKLKLTPGYYKVSITHVAQMLIASPTISHLVFQGVDITPTEGWASLAPIPLDHLKILGLVVPTESLKLLLSLIDLPKYSDDLSVYLGLYTKDIGHEILGFLSGSCVTTLHYAHMGCDRASLLHFSLLSPSLPSLHTLVFEDFHDPARSESGEELEMTPDPKPFNFSQTEVIFLSCQIEYETVSRFVAQTGVRSVRFEIGVGGDLNISQDEWESVRDRFAEDHPGLVCAISVDSTCNHNYRHFMDG